MTKTTPPPLGVLAFPAWVLGCVLCYRFFAQICAVCNDAKIVYDAKEGSFSRVGEPTEAALSVLVEKLGVPGACLRFRLTGKGEEEGQSINVVHVFLSFQFPASRRYYKLTCTVQSVSLKEHILLWCIYSTRVPVCCCIRSFFPFYFIEQADGTIW